jgi:hypothetical protein
MGRTALTKEQRQSKRREWNQRRFSDHEKLSKKRENDRIRKQERHQQARLITHHDPSILLTNTSIQAQIQNEG